MRALTQAALTIAIVAIAADRASAVSIPTSFGFGADAEITNDELAIDPGTGEPNPTNQSFADDAHGLLGQAGVRMQVDALFLTIIRHRVTLLRFDLSGVEGDFSGAYLELHSLAQGRAVDIFVLNDSAAEVGIEDWEEATITYNTAPGFQTLDPLPTSYVALDPSLVTEIGSWALPGPNSGSGPSTNIVASRSTPIDGAEPGKVYDDAILPTFSANLTSAIQADTNNLLTLIIIRTGADAADYAGNNGNVVLLTKEGLAADQAAETPVGFSIAPSLVLPNATPLDPGGLVGDFNKDGFVDGADLDQWKGDFGANANSDANGDEATDGADFLAWQRNYGAGTPPPAIVAAVAVPEPSALALGFVAMLCFVGRKRIESSNVTPA